MTQPSTRPSGSPTLRQIQPPAAQPAWPAALAVLGVGSLYFALPESLTPGPSWLLLAVVSVLLVPVILARMRGSFALNQSLGYVLLGVVTTAMLVSLYLLVRSLPGHQLAPVVLLRAAAALLGHQHPGLCFVVLASRCRWTAMRATSVAPTLKVIFSFPK